MVLFRAFRKRETSPVSPSEFVEKAAEIATRLACIGKRRLCPVWVLEIAVTLLHRDIQIPQLVPEAQKTSEDHDSIEGEDFVRIEVVLLNPLQQS